MVASGKLTQKVVNKIGVPKFLIVGPVRYNMKLAPGFEGDHCAFWPPQVWPAEQNGPQPHEKLFNKFGFRETVGYTQKRKEIDGYRHSVALQKTCR